MKLPGLLNIALILTSLALLAHAAAEFDVFKYINPLIGTNNGGLQRSICVHQTLEADGYKAMYFPVQLYPSGASLGNFPLFPQAGCPGDDLDRCKFSKVDRAIPRINGTASAHPGYFAVSLNNSVHAEMTVTNHTALYRFTYPNSRTAAPKSQLADETPLSPLILVDLTDLSDSRSGGNVSVNPKTGQMTGNGTFAPSFGVGSYVLHFCADFSGANVRDAGIWLNNRAGNATTHTRLTVDNVNTPPLPAGAYVRFHAPTKDNQMLARVGVSFISVEQACGNAEEEIPDFGFEHTLAVAEDAWRKKLAVVKVDATGVSAELQTVFWSGLYRAMISPQDYTGENPLWKSDEPYYDSYYCIWDSFRSIHPLITLVDPESQALMLRSLVDIYRHEGKLPDCRMSLCKGNTQGGSNADIVLADSYLKGITDSVNWTTAYEAVVSDAEIEPPNWTIEGRGGLMSWKNLHYIPTDDYDPYGTGLLTRSISRTVEYAYDDFCIAEMARKIGNMGDYEKCLQRAGFWKNMYNVDQTSVINGTDTGFKGFLQPRYLNGTFGYQDPIFCSPLLNFTSCYLNPGGSETYEGSSWLYTFFVPQDMASLIATLGGPTAFTERLDFLHASGLLYIGDEQAFLPVFQYHYAGRPGLSSKTVHSYIPSQFNTTNEGIPGNDDSGAMGSFSTLSMMGLWPFSGQNVYLIMPPFFPEVNLTNGHTGKTATVRNIGFDAGYNNIYIQNATLNGKAWTKNWISHDFYRNGGVLELTLGSEESSWGTRSQDLPPSASIMY
ncbi:hypothetical protein LTR39_000965 [Cryomyces antarcticus]|nr:hypothetical protein LTR39_000965 [Cryomyces antarcticus]